MARYIDADKVIEELQVDFDKQGEKADDMAMRGEYDLSVKYNHGQFCYLNAIERVKDSPTADVVPKSEVENIFEEIENAINLSLLMIEGILNAKGGRSNGKTILLAKYETFTKAKEFLAELKKKYTEGGAE